MSIGIFIHRTERPKFAPNKTLAFTGNFQNPRFLQT